MPLTCELGNIFPVTEHCVCKLYLRRRHPLPFWKIQTSKVKIQKYFDIQLFTLHRILISNTLFRFISTLKDTHR